MIFSLSAKVVLIAAASVVAVFCRHSCDLPNKLQIGFNYYFFLVFVCVYFVFLLRFFCCFLYFFSAAFAICLVHLAAVYFVLLFDFRGRAFGFSFHLTRPPMFLRRWLCQQIAPATPFDPLFNPKC